MPFTQQMDAGSISFDPVKRCFIFDKELLSFYDEKFSFRLSFVFNSKLVNSSHFPSGYKINLIKKICQDLSGNYYLINEFGNKVCFNGSGGHYISDDSTGLFLVISSNGYAVRDIEGNTENYDSNGYLRSVYDKYGNTSVVLNYDEYNTLTSIVHSDKSVNFSYSSDSITNISFNNLTISINSINNGYRIDHYSGVSYFIRFNNNEFISGSSYSIVEPLNFAKKIVVDQTLESNSLKMIEIESYIGNNVCDYSKYEFINDYYFDLTNRDGKKYRYSINNNMVESSFEVFNNMFDYTNDRYNGNISIKNIYFSGNLSINNGLMCERVVLSNDYEFGLTPSIESKCVTVYGFFRCHSPYPKNVNIIISSSIDEFLIEYTNVIEKDYTISNGEWYLFNASFVLPESYGRDIRISFTNVYETFGFKYVINDVNISQEYPILISKNDNSIIKLSGDYVGKVFINGISYTISKKITFSDLLCFSINQARGIYKNEVYCGHLTDIIYGVDKINNNYLSIYLDSNQNEYKMCDYHIGKIMISEGKEVIYKYIFNLDDFFLQIIKSLEESQNDDSEVVEVIDLNLDTVLTNADNVNYSINRMSNGLILSTSRSNGSLEFYEFNTYDSLYRSITSKTDYEGKTSSYQTNSIWGVTTQITSPSNNYVSFVFDSDFSNIISKKFNNTNEICIEYDDGLIDNISQSNVEIGYQYFQDKIVQVDECEDNVCFNSFSNLDKVISSTYANQYTNTIILDDYRRVCEIKHNALTACVYTYDLYPQIENGIQSVIGCNNGSSLLASKIDYIEGSVTKYGYNTSQLLSDVIKECNNNLCYSKSYSYDSILRLVESVFNTDLYSIKNTYLYFKQSDEFRANSKLFKEKLYMDDSLIITNEYNYDDFDRVTNNYKTFNSHIFKKQYSYYTSNSKTSNRMASCTYSIKLSNSSSYSIRSSVSLTIDNDYNIIQEVDPFNMFSFKKKYTYDSFGRLVREDSKDIGKSITYEYDERGNITSSSTYSYTESELPVSPLTTKTYIYDTNNKNRLISFNGNSIVYDSYGNPINYKGLLLSYQNNKLKTVTKLISENNGQNEIEFTYDSSMLRTRTVFENTPGFNPPTEYVTSSITNYIYDDNKKLISEEIIETYNSGITKDIKMIFLYDNEGISGLIFKMDSNPYEKYLFRKNHYGDVIEIYNTIGNIVVKYTYDAYGNFTIWQSGTTIIAKYNPICYRGYYYDRFVKMYYLRSRFYDCETGRFLTPDDYEYITTDSMSGLNRYAYCNNNPVMYSDGSGHMPRWVGYLCWGLAAAAVVGTGVALMIASGGSLAIAFSAAMAASCGVASSTTALTVTSFAFVGSTLGFIGASMFASRNGDMIEAGPSVLASTVTGGLYGGIGGYFSYQEQIGSNQSWSTIQKKYWNSKGYSHAMDGGDGYPMELNHTYGRYGTKINIFEETTHTEHVRFHQLYGYGRGSGGFNRYYPFTNIWEWLKWL